MTLRSLLPVTFLLGTLCDSRAWTPGTGSPGAADGLGVNTGNRRDTLAFYQAMYKASENYAANMAWTGNVSTGVAGDTSAAFKNDVRRRINFYRALVGQPGDITFNATKNLKDQKAALMFSRNNAISHNPPSTWTFYSADAAEAALKSNITLGTYGPPAVNGFMLEPGAGNEAVGHRRWLLFSRAQEMGTGDIPPNGSFSAANAIWVTDNFKPAPTPTFIKWPNQGYHPSPLMPARWSLSYPGASFANATVSMTLNGSNVPLNVVSKDVPNVGDNSIVWEPTGLPSNVTSDTTYNVTISGISGGGPTSHSYSVILFNPEILGESVVITGSSTPSTYSSVYQFNPIEQADGYQLKVSQLSSTAWMEGAEDATSSLITQNISAGYTLRQTAVKRSGSKAFQLALPSQATVNINQSFTLNRSIIPTATSKLEFHQLAKASLNTNTLQAEVSADGGSTWTSVWSRVGKDGNSSNWETNWNAAANTQSISLAAYAGQVIRIRFIFYPNGGGFIGSDANYGFFIDDITVTNSSQLSNETITTLAASATSFTLDSMSAGGALVAGTTYQLSIRPSVGLNWFGYGPLKSVTVQTPTGYDAWVANTYPTVTGGQADDPDQDGLSNAIEYAFGLNPTTNTPSSALPVPVISGSNYTVTFSTPPGVTGVTYAAQWSMDLSTWNPITDTGSGSTHTFSVSTTGRPKLFFRHNPTVTP